MRPNLHKPEIVLLGVSLGVFEQRPQVGPALGRISHLGYVKPNSVTITTRKRERLGCWELVEVTAHGGIEMRSPEC